MVGHLITEHKLSERTACKLIGISRSSHRYTSASSNDDELREQLKALAVQYSKHASKNEGGTNRNKRRGKINTLKKSCAAHKPRSFMKGVKAINLPPQQLIATDTSGTTGALKSKADALSRGNVRVVTCIGCGIRTTRI